MENFEMSLISDIFKHYNVVYDRECKIVSVNHPISVADFIYLKQLLRVSTLDVEDIRVGDTK
jgi:hypothetical protein